METKTNIAELLKDCPKGMELDCTMYDSVTLLSVDDREDICFPIRVIREDGNSMALTKYGQYTDANFAKCVIFPKGKTTWEGFVPPCKFKDGDIVATESGSWIGLIRDKSYRSYFTYAALDVDDGKFYTNRTLILGRLATEEEKQKLFDAIKANGYKWNAETKTLEKIVPKFKVGDNIVKRNCINNSWIVSSVSSEYYGLKSPNNSDSIGILPVSDQDEWELVPNKFDITTLKPFDKVLVRDKDTQKWCISFFSHCNGLEFYKYSCVNGSGYAYCIPYEGNEHLLGTTNDCDEYYKTWE